MAGKRPRIGDVIEIRTAKGLAYFQYASKDAEMGPLIRVLPGIFAERPGNAELLASAQELFFVHFPLGAAVSRGLVTIVGNAAVPLAHPARMKRPMSVARGGHVLNWAITENGKDRITAVLTDDERDLSPRCLWNDTLLAERIANGWKPSDDVR